MGRPGTRLRSSTRRRSHAYAEQAIGLAAPGDPNRLLRSHARLYRIFRLEPSFRSLWRTFVGEPWLRTFVGTAVQNSRRRRCRAAAVAARTFYLHRSRREEVTAIRVACSARAPDPIEAPSRTFFGNLRQDFGREAFIQHLREELTRSGAGGSDRSAL